MKRAFDHELFERGVGAIGPKVDGKFLFAAAVFMAPLIAMMLLIAFYGAGHI